MSRRPTLGDLRRQLPSMLSDEWKSPDDLCAQLGLGKGLLYYKTALTLERLANDGVIEIQASGNRRRFRRAA